MRRIDSLLSVNPSLSNTSLSNASSSSPNINNLNQYAEALQITQSMWRQVAPPAVVPFSHAGTLKNGHLTIYADNGAIATKIKLLNTSLLMQLENLTLTAPFCRGAKVTAIQVKVQAKSSLVNRKKPVRKLSIKAAHSLSEFAKNLKDSPLRNAINQLSKRI